MTVKELYEYTKAIMFEKPSSRIYDDYLIPNVNRVIEELFFENNSAREFAGYAPLVDYPFVTGLDDEIEFEPEYQRIMAKGLASYFLIDDDLQKYSIFHTDYMNARMVANKVVVL